MQQFEKKNYDATNYIESCCILVFCPFCGWTTKKLELDTDEAILKTDNNCTHTVQKRPYAQLGSVDSVNNCGVCWGVKSDISGAEGEISRGCGCDEGWVKEVLSELQQRKVGRGNIAQIKAQEVLAERVDHLHTKLDLVLAHLKIDVPPAPALGKMVRDEADDAAGPSKQA
jgi:hypothetical protein